jgi:RNA polymerase sigma factor (sigma-70 family)
MGKARSTKGKDAGIAEAEIPDLPLASSPQIGVEEFPAEQSSPFLSAEEETLLLARLREGDESARACLTSAHIPLVQSIARAYRNKGLTQDDLVQEGFTGLMRATERFREGMGTRFSSYATWWIREAMQRALIRSRFIRLPDYLAKSLHALGQEEKEGVVDQKERVRKRAESMGVRESTVRALDFADIRLSSLDDELYEGMTRMDHIADDVPSPAQQYDQNAYARAIQSFLLELNVKQREVMICRFGLHGDKPMTLEEVAERLGVSREAIRQIQVRALNRLKQLLAEGGWEV